MDEKKYMAWQEKICEKAFSYFLDYKVSNREKYLRKTIRTLREADPTLLGAEIAKDVFTLNAFGPEMPEKTRNGYRALIETMIEFYSLIEKAQPARKDKIEKVTKLFRKRLEKSLDNQLN